MNVPVPLPVPLPVPVPVPLPVPGSLRSGSGSFTGTTGRAGATVALACALALGCGYHFAHGYRAVGGAERIHVEAFENLSADPELGAALTSALRSELRRRGADAADAGAATLVGEVRSGAGVPSAAGAATWRVSLEVRARLVVRGETVAERTVRREADHLGGADALETEGRRAVALRTIAGDAARELLRALESP